jgi:hypothetical protein
MEMPTPADLDAEELGELFMRLEAWETHLSQKRTSLHKRIDFLQTGGHAHLDASVEQLRVLKAEEESVSEERRALHGYIADVRAELRKRRAERAEAVS